MVVHQFFDKGWILPNFNSSSVVLIPKHDGADRAEQFRPIAMANFKFKIISKVLADRLAIIAPYIISVNQRGFVKGRSIVDCICSASEGINLLDKRSFGGQIAMKIDIKKAFDTIDWTFLVKVLQAFGFCEKFCLWISIILHSARLSISINGHAVGFSGCSGGVRQGDPLSLLFCLAEEVLDRGISKLVEVGKVQLMAGPRGAIMPSHVLFADDIMIFSRASRKSLSNLLKLFSSYEQASGHVISKDKSKFFVGNMSQVRKRSVSDLLDFSVGLVPFIYLGIPFFKGKPKRMHMFLSSLLFA